MHEFSKMLSRKNIHTSAYLTASKYHRLPVQIKFMENLAAKMSVFTIRLYGELQVFPIKGMKHAHILFILHLIHTTLYP